MIVSILRRLFGTSPLVAQTPRAATAERLGIRAGETLLYVLEERRTQLGQKATVSVAAASGTIVVCLQFVVNDVSATRISLALGLGAVVAAAVSVLQGLSVIRALGRRQVKQRSRTHLFYFGTIANLGADGTKALLEEINDGEYIEALAIQAVSLSHNLRERYNALLRGYRWVASAILLLCLAVGVQETAEVFGPSLPARDHTDEHPTPETTTPSPRHSSLPATTTGCEEPSPSPAESAASDTFVPCRRPLLNP